MRGNVAVVLAVLMLGAAGAGAQSEDPAEDESAEPLEKRPAPSLLTEADQACRADPLPNFRLSKSGSSWSMAPAPNLESGNRDHVIYAVGQKRILTRVSSQTVAGP